MCSGITWPPSGTRAASNRSEIIAPIYDDDGEIDDNLIRLRDSLWEMVENRFNTDMKY